MKKIQRPTAIGEVGTMLHMAEFFLTQAKKIVDNICIGPEAAVPANLSAASWKISKRIESALEELKISGSSSIDHQTCKFKSLPVGTHIKFTRALDRFPHFIVPQGTTGTVIHSDNISVHVLCHQHVDGCEPWGNKVVFTSDDEDMRNIKVLES